MARLMALDVGDARIGVAVSDPTGFLASPYTTIHVSRNEQQTWDAIQRLLEETEAEGIVIGLPISLDGQIHAQGRKVQSFVERLQPHISVPVTFWDERLSTVEAERLRAGASERLIPRGRPVPTEQGGRRVGQKRQRQAGRVGSQSKRRQRGHEIDALAATVILQEYLHHLSQCPQTDLRDEENSLSPPAFPCVSGQGQATAPAGSISEEKNV